jgi:Helix-turn-helix domain
MSAARSSSSTIEPSAPLAPSIQLITLDEVAARLQLSYWGSRDLVARGHLPAVRLPGRPGKNLRRILVSVADLERFIAEHKVQRVHIPTPNPNMKRRRPHRQRHQHTK